MTRFSLIVGVTLAATGCGTLPDGSRWGQDAFTYFDSNRIAKAAKDAFLSPHTLIPLAGAAVFAIDDFDERASDWATDRTPVFGSEKDARDASDQPGCSWAWRLWRRHWPRPAAIRPAREIV